MREPDSQWRNDDERPFDWVVLMAVLALLASIVVPGIWIVLATLVDVVAELVI